jgi:hypothetical protein
MKKNISLILISLCGALLASHAVAQATAQTPGSKSRITIASGVRVRATPNTSGEEVTRLPIGTIVPELEQSTSKEKIGGAEDYWYRVTAPGGKEGWVFGSFTAAFDPNNRAAIYKRIATERLKVENASFADLADLARFLTAATAETADRPALAELQLARLLAMKRAAESLPTDKQDQPPYSTWIKANNDAINYSEPGGQWLLQSDLFWRLADTFRDLPIAERIAWEAASNQLGGECEDDISCNLGALNLTEGRYLNLYPRGAHAEEALGNIQETLKSITEMTQAPSEMAAQYRKDGLDQITALRASVTKTTSAKKAPILQQLDLCVKYFRR